MIPIPVGPNADDLPEETSESLQEITTRLERSISELFAQSTVDKTTSAKDTDSNRHLEAQGGCQTTDDELDRRLYLPNLEGWQVRVKSGPNVYCCQRNPGQDWFHLIVDGELYLEFDHEKLCLNCALRHRILTDDRLFWQSGSRGRRRTPITDQVEDQPKVRSLRLADSDESTGSLE